MINFWIGPRSKKEISIAFDYFDAENILETLKEIKKEGSGAVVDVARLMNGSNFNAKLEIHSVLYEDDERAEVTKSGMSIFLAEDSLDYAIFKIEKFIVEGDFSPAEFGCFKSSKGFDFNIYFIGKI